MWKIAYNILITIVLPILVIFSLTKTKVRKNLAERLFPSAKHARIKSALWIHAASIGEAAIAETLVTYMERHSHISNFVLTTNTYYTRDLLKKKFGNRVNVFSLPFDFIYAINQFIDDSTFEGLVIVETELWPNLIWQVKKRGIPVIIVNGRISDATLNNYRRFSFFFKHVFSQIDFVFSQSEEHAKRFMSIGMVPEKVINTGNLKYYRDIQDDAQIQKENIITFGSIKEKEISILLPVITRLKKTFPEFLIFIAPRELTLIDILEKELSGTINTVRYSQLKDRGKKETDVVIVDTVGELLDIYKKSRVAFVGGSLAPYGGQNILEPLFFGTPVIFGPYMENFKDIADTVLDQKAGITVSDGDTLYGEIKTVLDDEALRKEMGNNGKKIIELQGKVLENTVHRILETIKVHHS